MSDRFTKYQPKDGEIVMHCGHLENKPHHFFAMGDPDKECSSVPTNNRTSEMDGSLLAVYSNPRYGSSLSNASGCNVDWR